MKIAIVVPGGVDRSGSHKVIPALLWLIERLARDGNDVHVFALFQEPRPGRWPLLGATVHNAGARPRRLRAVAQMLTEHRKARFDIVHAFWAGPSGQAAALFRIVTGVPMILSLPGGDLAAIPDIGYGGRLSWRGRMRTRAVLAAASCITTPSAWQAGHAAAAGVNSIRLPYGIALDRWSPRPPRLRAPNATLRLIHVADLNRVKDQATLLKAARLLRERGLPFTIDIVGTDTLGGDVQRQARALGLEQQVRFHGFLPQAEIRPMVERADLLVMSSRHESVPIALLEAAVVGVPTVGTAVGLIADWAPDGAVAVPVADAHALADAIEALARDEAARLALARTAQSRAIAEDADAAARLALDLYSTLSRGEVTP